MFIAILTYKKPLSEVDPFHINGIADYQVVEFTPTMFVTEGLKPFLL